MNDFWSLELRAVNDIIEQRAKAETDKNRDTWERARWLAAISLQPHAKKGATIKPTDLIKFDWDNEQKQTAKPKKDVQELWAKWDAEMKAKHGR